MIGMGKVRERGKFNFYNLKKLKKKLKRGRVFNVSFHIIKKNFKIKNGNIINVDLKPTLMIRLFRNDIKAQFSFFSPDTKAHISSSEGKV